MPCTTWNSQDARVPSVSSLQSSATPTSGTEQSSGQCQSASLASPQFIAEVVQAVKVALAAKKAAEQLPDLPALSVTGPAGTFLTATIASSGGCSHAVSGGPFGGLSGVWCRFCKQPARASAIKFRYDFCYCSYVCQHLFQTNFSSIAPPNNLHVLISSCLTKRCWCQLR